MKAKYSVKKLHKCQIKKKLKLHVRVSHMLHITASTDSPALCHIKVENIIRFTLG